MIHGITSYGLEYYLITPEEWAITKVATYSCGWTDYDRQQIEMHLLNCGFGILETTYGTPIDNEYDLEEIYNQVETITR